GHLAVIRDDSCKVEKATDDEDGEAGDPPVRDKRDEDEHVAEDVELSGDGEKRADERLVLREEDQLNCKPEQAERCEAPPYVRQSAPAGTNNDRSEQADQDPQGKRHAGTSTRGSSTMK